MNRLLPSLLLASGLLPLSATTFDFGNGASSANNSTNGGLGNVIAAEGGAPEQSATIDGILLTIAAVNSDTGGTGTSVSLGSNSQGWGVRSSGETGASAASRRVGGSIPVEAFEFSFNEDVTFDSLRLGSFSSGKVLTLALVSGPNPFTTGTSLTFTGTGAEGPDVDISLASGIGPVLSGTVLRLSASTPTGGGFLFNEMTINDSAPPVDGNLTTSILALFPTATITDNPNPTTNLGSTTVALENSVGQSFSLPTDTTLDSFVFEINGLITTGDFTLELFRAMDGLPWLLSPIYSNGVNSYSGTLPAGLAAGDLLQIDLPAPLDVLRGSYVIALSGLANTKFSLVLTNDDLYPTGALSHNNSSTNAWEPLPASVSDAVFAVLGTEGVPAPAAPGGAPNIVFILADDLGWTDIRTGGQGPNVLHGTDYGSGYYQTLNLARLASEGLSFTNCFVHPNCSPTRAALLSGQYSARSGNGVYIVNGLNRGVGNPTYDGPSQRDDIPAKHLITAETLQADYAVHGPTGNSHARGDLLTKYNGVSTTPEHNVASYAAIVENMDQTIGRVLDYLDDPNGDGNPADSIAANTLVIFLSDNGGHIGPTDNDPLRHRKGSFYNGGIRVPLIVRQTGTTPIGIQTDTLVHAVDFYPTIIEAAGLTMPTVNEDSEPLTFDGTSFANHLDDPVGKPRARETIFYHFPGYLDQRARPCEVAIKKVNGKDYKLIYTYDLAYTGNPSNTEDISEGLDVLNEPWELYCFSDDLDETDDLLDGSYSNWLLYGGIATTMANELVAWLNQGGSDWDAKKLTLDGTSTEVPLVTAAELQPVTVPAADVFRILRISPNLDTEMVTIDWPSEVGFLYDIQVSSNLTNWDTIVPDIPGTGNPTSHPFSDPLIASETERFYRIVLHD